MGLPWGDTCTAAAANGHLACLKYAHENGCPWNSTTCEAAAAAHHLTCLQYACENGCPWNGAPVEAPIVAWGVLEEPIAAPLLVATPLTEAQVIFLSCAPSAQ